MAIHEFVCTTCGESFEKWEHMDDPPPKECPSCGAAAVERLISECSFHLRGDGWPGKEAKEGKR